MRDLQICFTVKGWCEVGKIIHYQNGSCLSNRQPPKDIYSNSLTTTTAQPASPL